MPSGLISELCKCVDYCVFPEHPFKKKNFIYPTVGNLKLTTLKLFKYNLFTFTNSNKNSALQQLMFIVY